MFDRMGVIEGSHPDLSLDREGVAFGFAVIDHVTVFATVRSVLTELAMKQFS